MACITENLLDRQKDSIILGTYETSAFILSLKSPEEFTSIHSFGYHRIPHIGVYGTDYSVALPMVLLSFPATTRSIQSLPTDLLAALNLNHLHVPQSQKNADTGKLPTSSSATCSPVITHHSLTAHIYSMCTEYMRSGSNTLSNEQMVAKAIVDFALRAACRRMVLTGASLLYQEHEAVSLESPRKSAHYLRKGSAEISMDWRQPSVDYDGYMSASSELLVNNITSTTITVDDDDEVKQKNVSFHIEANPMPVDAQSDVYYCEQVRIVAKKLVNKALHSACHKLEALYRRSSIEYLIASTKRMRIDDSPPPPPTLFETEEQSDRVSDFLAPKARSPLDRLSRKKRGRSGSHEVSQLNELRQMKLGKGFQFQSAKHAFNNSTGSSESSPSRRILSVARYQCSAPVESNLATMNSTSSLNDAQRLSSLVSDVKRMSISTCSESESDITLDNEETYTILSAVTVDSLQEEEEEEEEVEEDADADDDDDEEEEEAQTVGGGQMLYTGVLPCEKDGMFTQTTYLKNQNGSCTGTNDGYTFPISSGLTRDQVSDTRIADMDLLFIIHTHPSPGICQKFLCSNTDEVNLLYHCWLFPDVPFSSSLIISKKLEMGVFSPSGVQPVHLDLQDAGVPFGYLSERTVCIHSCCFSPENAQLQLLTGTSDLYMFYSAARSGERRVVALHVLPASEDVEQNLRECTQACSTLRQLCESLVSNFPRVGQKVLDLIQTV